MLCICNKYTRIFSSSIRQVFFYFDFVTYTSMYASDGYGAERARTRHVSEYDRKATA